MSTIFDTSYLERGNVRRERHGKPWESSEYARLSELYMRRASLQRMCEDLGRPAAGVIPKLEDLGCIARLSGNWRDPASKVWYCRMEQNPIPAPLGKQVSYDLHSPSNSNPNPDPQEEPTMSASTPKTIETRILIQGEDASQLSDGAIFTLIAKLEAQAEKLGAIKAKPKKLEAAIAEIQADIAKLCNYVDTRGADE